MSASRLFFPLGATVLLLGVGTAAAQTGGDQALVQRHCLACHTARALVGGMSLEGLQVTAAGRNPDEVELWEKVVRKLRTRAMPPPGRPRPSEPEYESLAGRLESALDAAAVADVNPGRRPAVHRLNRAEYATAIRDLLSLEIDARARSRSSFALPSATST